MKHYSEADLLETYYMQPGESMPVMMHLADCGDCAARYEKLETKIRAAAGCPAEKPETFWSRQRISIMRRLTERPRRITNLLPVIRVAAAALLAFVLGGAVVYRHMTLRAEPAATPKAPVVATETITHTQPQHLEPQGQMDPWESEELREFHAVVEWESWVPEAHPVTGDDAL